MPGGEHPGVQEPELYVWPSLGKLIVIDGGAAGRACSLRPMPASDPDASATTRTAASNSPRVVLFNASKRRIALANGFLHSTMALRSNGTERAPGARWARPVPLSSST